MVTLRPYQDTAVAAIRAAFNRDRHRRVLFVLPTGGGKTTIFSYIAARSAMAGQRVWINAHRDELLSQISKSLDSFGVRHGVIGRGRNGTWHEVQVCGIKTLRHRLGKLPEAPDLFIDDEGHHRPASDWCKIHDYYSDVRTLLVTATPERLDGKGLRPYADVMLLGPSAKWLTENGFLAPAVVYAPPLINMDGLHTKFGDYSKGEIADRIDRPTICGEAVGHYKRLAMGKQFIVFCVNLKHVEHIVAEYRTAGIEAASIDGKMSNSERSIRVRDFGNGTLKVLVNCDLISEGFDVPGCDGVQQLRATQSLSLDLQQIGRCLRPAPGKTEAIILDHVRNWERHGLPTDERDWELTTGRATKRKSGHDAVGLRQCLACYNVYPAFMAQCTRCGAAPAVKDRTPETVDGELQKIEAAPPIITDPIEAKRLMDSAYTLKQWHSVARKLGKSHRWAWWQHSTQGLRGYSEQN